MTGLQLFTHIHTVLSLVAVLGGFVVVIGLMNSQGRQLWTFGFLVTAWLTTITGFFFPFNGVTPAFILGIVSFIPLTLATLARYKGQVKGSWRGTYAINAVLVLYFNVFVLIVQMFQKIPSLSVLAPTQTELPFKIVQAAALALFAAIGVVCYRNFQPTFLDPITKKFESPNL